MEAEVLSFDTEIQGVIEALLHEDFGVGEDGDGLISFQLEPLALPLEGEVPSHLADILDAEDRWQMMSGEQGPMNIGGVGGGNGKALVVGGEVGVPEKLIGSVGGGDSFQTQLFDKAVLEGAKEPFDASFGLGAMGMEDLDLQFSQGAGVLGLWLTIPELFLNGGLSGGEKNAVFIHIEGHRTAFLFDIGPGGLHEGLGVLGVREDRIGDFAGGIVDERHQDTGGGPVFEPAVMGAIHLEEFSITGSALSPSTMAELPGVRGPQPLGSHESSDSFRSYLDAVGGQFFGGEGGAKIRVVGCDQGESLGLHLRGHLVIGRTAPELVGQPGRAQGLQSAAKAADLAGAQVQ